MIKPSPIIIGFLFGLMPSVLFAANQTLTMEWSATGINNISGYTMYYSDNAQMNNKSLACTNNQNPQTRTSLTCSFDISGYPFYAQIAAMDADTGEELLSQPQEIIEDPDTGSAKISKVQGFTIVIPSGITTSYLINFQPQAADIPAGFSADSGLTYSIARGYGWSEKVNETRDRNNSASPNQSYDTLIHVGPANFWELSLPNGNYQVTVCVGDPSFPDSSNDVRAEGIQIIKDGRLSSNQRWIEQSANVTVNDGRLTLTFSGSSPTAKLCWVKVNGL